MPSSPRSTLGTAGTAEHLDTTYDGNTLKAYKIAVARFSGLVRCPGLIPTALL